VVFLLRRFLEERLKKGPILKELKEMIFEATTELLDSEKFIERLREDLERNMNYYALIISPFLKKDTVYNFCNFRETRNALKGGKKIIVVTRLPSEVNNPKDHESCIKILEDRGIKVVKQPKFHFKAVIIDDLIIYIGSINPLFIVTGEDYYADYMIRFVSEVLVDEILRTFAPDYEKWLETA
jgi:hypothetical protein